MALIPVPRVGVECTRAGVRQHTQASCLAAPPEQSAGGAASASLACCLEPAAAGCRVGAGESCLTDLRPTSLPCCAAQRRVGQLAAAGQRHRGRAAAAGGERGGGAGVDDARAHRRRLHRGRHAGAAAALCPLRSLGSLAAPAMAPGMGPSSPFRMPIRSSWDVWGIFPPSPVSGPPPCLQWGAPWRSTSRSPCSTSWALSSTGGAAAWWWG